jgi:hypothetical protein
MTTCRLFLVLLVLLQSWLVAGSAHAHPGCGVHGETPHVHACALLAPFTTADHHEHDGDDHDADAVYLSDVIAATAPPAPEVVTLDLAPVERGAAFEAVACSFPLGLPPSTAGPQRPLYLTLCTLTI